jgi:hypothetical protein
VPLSPLRVAGLLLAFAVLAGAQPTMATAVTAALAVLVVAVLASTVTAEPAAVLLSSETLRRRARLTAFLPRLSPTAPGRPRPRAPSAT